MSFQLRLRDGGDGRADDPSEARHSFPQSANSLHNEPVERQFAERFHGLDPGIGSKVSPHPLLNAECKKKLAPSRLPATFFCKTLYIVMLKAMLSKVEKIVAQSMPLALTSGPQIMKTIGWAYAGFSRAFQ